MSSHSQGKPSGSDNYVFCAECKKCYKTKKMPTCPSCKKLIKHFVVRGAYYCENDIPGEILGSDYEECYKCNKLRNKMENN